MQINAPTQTLMRIQKNWLKVEMVDGGGPGSHRHSFLFTLRQELISFAAFKRSVGINISTSAIVLPLKITLSRLRSRGKQSPLYQVSEHLFWPLRAPSEICFRGLC